MAENFASLRRQEAAWNAVTKEGGLKPADRRAAVLLFLTWSHYVLGGVVGAALAMTFDWPAAAGRTRRR